MSKREQVLILNPATEIKFKGPYTDVVTRSLDLSNPSDQRVAFKIKTTTPKRYCVRPNSGTLNPGETTSVSIMLQPYDQETDKTKHKFMVQSIFLVKNEQDSNSDNYWKTANTDTLMDTKLKCVFEDDDSPKKSQTASTGGTGDTEKSLKVDMSSAGPSPTPMYQALSTQGASQTGKGQVDKAFPQSPAEQAHFWEEMQELRSENERLKKDGLRYRNLALDQSFSTAKKLNTSASTSMSGGHSYGRKDEEKMLSYRNMAVMMLMVLIGMLLAKILF